MLRAMRHAARTVQLNSLDKCSVAHRSMPKPWHLLQLRQVDRMRIPTAATMLPRRVNRRMNCREMTET